MISKLLNRDRYKRLGAIGDAEEILSHRFFRGVSLNKIIQKKFKAPYVPQQKDLNPIVIDPECKKILLE